MRSREACSSPETRLGDRDGPAWIRPRDQRIMSPAPEGCNQLQLGAKSLHIGDSALHLPTRSRTQRRQVCTRKRTLRHPPPPCPAHGLAAATPLKVVDGAVHLRYEEVPVGHQFLARAEQHFAEGSAMRSMCCGGCLGGRSRRAFQGVGRGGDARGRIPRPGCGSQGAGGLNASPSVSRSHYMNAATGGAKRRSSANFPHDASI